jgi:hypothetical protein
MFVKVMEDRKFEESDVVSVLCRLLFIEGLIDATAKK